MKKCYKIKDQTILVDIEIKLLQEVRLIHAIAESKNSVVISKKNLLQIENIEKNFGALFKRGNKGDLKLSEIIKINHILPQTEIGKVIRPLIFPHAVFQKTKKYWMPQRKYKVVFPGLLTSDRKKKIWEWLKKNSSSVSFLSKIKNYIKWEIAKRNQEYGKVFFSINNGIFLCWFSSRGRHFPCKSWDEEYFKLLGNSEFVLCPEGDCVWSYRFFEAACCGALPIVEQHVPIYNKFYLKKLYEDVKTLIWSKKIAENNFNHAKALLSIPYKKLDKELEKLLKRKL